MPGYTAYLPLFTIFGYMTIPAEIEALQVELDASTHLNKQAEILVHILAKHKSISLPGSEPHIEKLAAIALQLNDKKYMGWVHYFNAATRLLLGNFPLALEQLQLAQNIFGGLDEPLALASTYASIGFLYQRQGKYSESFLNYEKALKIRNEWSLTGTGSAQINNQNGIASVYNGIGMSYYFSGDIAKARSYSMDALEINRRNGDKVEMANTYKNIAILHYEKEQYAEALENNRVALKLKEEIGDQVGISGLYTNIMAIYAMQGKYIEAISCGLEALKIAEEIRDEYNVLLLRLNIGVIYGEMENFEQALTYFLSIKKYKRETSYGSIISSACSNIGMIYTRMGRFEEGIAILKEDLQYRTEIGSKMGAADATAKVGMAYDRQGNFQEALSWHFSALKLYEDIKEPSSSLIDLYLHIGKSLNGIGDTIKANEYLLKALEMTKETDNKSRTVFALEGLYKLEKGRGNGMAALDYYEQFIELEKQLQNEEVTKKIASLQFDYQLENKEKEAEIERLKNTELKQALEKLQQEKQLNEQLFHNQMQDLKLNALQAQMNPHFVFNSLNAIQQYIWTKDPAEASAYLARFSKLIRSILDNSRRQFVTLEQDLTALEYYIELESIRFEKKFEYDLVMDPEINKAKIELPPMIIQPFVENAIVHGLLPLNKPGRLGIEIKLRDSNLLHIVIRDNGVGRQHASSLKSKSGKSHQSVALQLTKERLEKMNAQQNENSILISDLYDTDRNPAGTMVEIEVPVECI